MYLCNKEIYHIFKTCCIIFVLFSTHCHLYSNIYPTRCNVTQFILSGNCSTYLGWYHHPSSGAQTTVSTASGICHTVTATCRYHGRVGAGLSVLWVVYTTHSTLRPLKTLRLLPLCNGNSMLIEGKHK
jgi:hypothetical protein